MIKTYVKGYGHDHSDNHAQLLMRFLKISLEVDVS